MAEPKLTKKQKEMLKKQMEKKMDEKTNEGYDKYYEDEEKGNKADREKMMKVLKKLLGK